MGNLSGPMGEEYPDDWVGHDDDLAIDEVIRPLLPPFRPTFLHNPSLSRDAMTTISQTEEDDISILRFGLVSKSFPRLLLSLYNVRGVIAQTAVPQLRFPPP